jgi:hypothetical protein
VLLAACAAAPAGGGNARLALVIGNAAYENAPALRNPVNDANDMCAALRRVGFTTLCHTNLRDRAEFDARVGDYVDRLGPNTVGVVYYSGHGVQAGNANFLIPTQVSVKTATEDPLRVLYGLDELFDRLRQKPTRFQFVVPMPVAPTCSPRARVKLAGAELRQVHARPFCVRSRPWAARAAALRGSRTRLPPPSCSTPPRRRTRPTTVMGATARSPSMSSCTSAPRA